MQTENQSYSIYFPKELDEDLILKEIEWKDINLLKDELREINLKEFNLSDKCRKVWDNLIVKILISLPASVVGDKEFQTTPFLAITGFVMALMGIYGEDNWPIGLAEYLIKADERNINTLIHTLNLSVTLFNLSQIDLKKVIQPIAVKNILN